MSVRDATGTGIGCLPHAPQGMGPVPGLCPHPPTPVLSVDRNPQLQLLRPGREGAGPDVRPRCVPVTKWFITRSIEPPAPPHPLPRERGRAVHDCTFAGTRCRRPFPRRAPRSPISCFHRRTTRVLRPNFLAAGPGKQVTGTLSPPPPPHPKVHARCSRVQSHRVPAPGAGVGAPL